MPGAGKGATEHVVRFLCLPCACACAACLCRPVLTTVDGCTRQQIVDGMPNRPRSVRLSFIVVLQKVALFRMFAFPNAAAAASALPFPHRPSAREALAGRGHVLAHSPIVQFPPSKCHTDMAPPPAERPTARAKSSPGVRSDLDLPAVICRPATMSV